MSVDDDFLILQQVHPNIAPHQAWEIAMRFPNLRVVAKYVIDLCARTVENPRQLLSKNAAVLS